MEAFFFEQKLKKKGNRKCNKHISNVMNKAIFFALLLKSHHRLNKPWWQREREQTRPPLTFDNLELTQMSTSTPGNYGIIHIYTYLFKKGYWLKQTRREKRAGSPRSSFSLIKLNVKFLKKMRKKKKRLTVGCKFSRWIKNYTETKMFDYIEKLLRSFV